MSAALMFAVAGASLALWALLAWLDRLAVICALAFFAALGFGVAGAVEADPDDCQPGVPYLNC